MKKCSFVMPPVSGVLKTKKITPVVCPFLLSSDLMSRMHEVFFFLVYNQPKMFKSLASFAFPSSVMHITYKNLINVWAKTLNVWRHTLINKFPWDYSKTVSNCSIEFIGDIIRSVVRKSPKIHVSYGI